MPIKKLLNKIFSRTRTKSDAGLPEALKQAIEFTYPRNHAFAVCQKKLKPSSDLLKRYKKIHAHYPKPLTSLLDLSCCRGYFVLEAATEKTCERALGIDIYQPDLDTCESLKNYLHLPHAQFKFLRLTDLADQIEAFGGPFQTALLVNTYQYLFFGSERFSECYLDHDKIFSAIRKVCSGRLIFNNRAELQDCQNQEAIKQANPEIAKNYNSAAILAAASKYFNLILEGTLGGYPLWVFEAK